MTTTTHRASCKGDSVNFWWYVHPLSQIMQSPWSAFNHLHFRWLTEEKYFHWNIFRCTCTFKRYELKQTCTHANVHIQNFIYSYSSAQIQPLQHASLYSHTLHHRLVPQGRAGWCSCRSRASRTSRTSSGSSTQTTSPAAGCQATSRRWCVVCALFFVN